MQQQRIAQMGILSAVTFMVGFALAAEDKYTLKSPNGIAFSEFKGYEAWPVMAVSQPDETDGCGTSKTGCMKAILGNPVMMKAYAEGIPANGKPVPDGAAIAKVEWSKKHNAAAPYSVTVPEAQTEVSFMVKDSKRFPDTNGWGYATFRYDATSDTYRVATTDASVMKTLCHTCHTAGAKARDYVYTSYAKR
jgi:Cytochrome P460